MPWALGRLWRGANLASSSIFFDHVLGDDHRLLEILAAMNDAMANGFHSESAALSQEFNDSKECGPMVGHR
jgi:hypothetical protein